MLKKLLAVLLIAVFTLCVPLFAQDEIATEQTEVTENVTDDATVTDEAADAAAPIAQPQEMGGLESLARSIVGNGFVDLFVKGGFAMWPILILLIWALAVIIWKLVALSYGKVKVNNLLERIIPLIEEKKYDEAIAASKEFHGPAATIVEAGLLKAHLSVDEIEKSIDNAAAIEMAFLEKGFVALGTTITLAPMFGFFGTLVGMIQAFQAIEDAGEVEASIVASGIKVALITSAAGLACAIPVQFFNNIFQTMSDGIIIDMQKTSEKVVEAISEAKGE